MLLFRILLASIAWALLSLLMFQSAAAQPQGIQLGQARSKTPTTSVIRSSIGSVPSAAAGSQAHSPIGTSAIELAPGEILVGEDDHTLHDVYGAPALGDCDALHGCATPAGNWLLDWSRAELAVGALAFVGGADFLATSPASNGETAGNFGFQQAFNFGSQLPSVLHGELGLQFGLRATQTNLDGNRLSSDQRNQLFLTTGLYRRVDCGLQAGLAIDYLHEDWLYQVDLMQLRGELSWLLTPFQDIGFRFTDSQQTDQTTAFTNSGVLPIRLASLNTYRIFYRHPLGERGRGTAEWQLGFSDDSQALLGMQILAPLSGELGLQVDAKYLLPEGETTTAYRDEGWNLGFGLVWTPGRRFGTARDYYRPLFQVADNGSMFITREL